METFILKSKMRAIPLMFSVALMVAPYPSGAMECPAPSAQLAKDIEADIKGRLSGISILPATEIVGKASVKTVDMFSKYPNADRVVIANSMISMFCQNLSSSRLADKEKMSMITDYTEIIFRAAFR